MYRIIQVLPDSFPNAAYVAQGRLALDYSSIDFDRATRPIAMDRKVYLALFCFIIC